MSRLEELKAEIEEQLDRQKRMSAQQYDNEERFYEIARKAAAVKQIEEQRKAIMTAFELTMLALQNLGK